MSILLKKLEKWREENPQKIALRFIDGKGEEQSKLSYQELYQKANQVADYLCSSENGLGLQTGQRVLLVYPPCLDFIVVFLGCLIAKMIAVPVYPPDPRKAKKDVLMFSTIAHDCGATIALTNEEYSFLKKMAGIQQKFSFAKDSWPVLKWIATDQIISSSSKKSSPLSTTFYHSDVAFLQYTSGSTSNPKGVQITHGNLNHNLISIATGVGASTCTIVVSWLPQYHDMGLIGSYLGVIYSGGSGVYMNPFDFIRNPILWIEMISKYRATHIQAPDFAYELTARKWPENGLTLDINLSSLEHAINAAEPIQSASMNHFYDTFAPLGLPPNVIKPTYGLAEHTVFVCQGGTQHLHVNKQVLEEQGKIEMLDDDDDDNQNRKEMIGCGYPRKTPDLDLRIVNTDTLEELPDGHVGEIWLSSPSKALGYYGANEASNQVFEAQLVSSSINEDQGKKARTLYLRTGDLGFIFKSELFICGRLKDLIIIRGRNHFPQDLEHSVETSVKAVRPGCTAAFSSSASSSEELIIMAELYHDNDPSERNKKTHTKEEYYAQCCQEIRHSISEDHGITPSCIVLLSSRTIPKTTSGKIARHRCKLAYKKKTLDELYRSSNRTQGRSSNHMPKEAEPSPDNEDTDGGSKPIMSDEEILQVLKHEIGSLLELERDQVDEHMPLQQLGMDSLALTQLRGIITHKFPDQNEIDDEIIYDDHTSITTIYHALVGSAMEEEVESKQDEEDHLPIRVVGKASPRRKWWKSSCCCSSSSS